MQKIKLEEVGKCVEEQEVKFNDEQERKRNRTRRLTMQLNADKKKALGKMATNKLKLYR